MMEITVADIGTACGYLGTLWVVAKLIYGVVRNDGIRCLIYGIGTFAAVVVMLNIGGVLNERSWSMFGAAVFGIHLAIGAATGQPGWKLAIYGLLLAASVLSILGMVRFGRPFYNIVRTDRLPGTRST